MELFITTIAVGAALQPHSSLRTSTGQPASAAGVQVMLLAVFAGAAAGALAIGRVAVFIGPRRALVWTCAGFGLLSLGTAFMVNFATFTAARVTTAFFLAGLPPLVYTMLADMLPAAGRGRVILIASAIGTCGIALAALTTFVGGIVTPLGLEGWRTSLVLCGLGSLAVVILLQRQPESPRWLERTGRGDEARKVVQMLIEASPIRGWLGRVVAGRSITRCDSVATELAEQRGRNGGFAAVVRFGVHMFLAAVAVGGFNQLNTAIMLQKGYTLESSVAYAGFGYLGAPLGILLSAGLLERFRQRVILAFMSGAMAFLGLGLALFSSIIAMMLCALGWSLLSSAYITIILVYATQSFPQEARPMGNGVVYAVNRLAGLVVPLVLFPLLLTHGPAALFAIIAGLLLANASLFLFGGRGSPIGNPFERRDIIPDIDGKTHYEAPTMNCVELKEYGSADNLVLSRVPTPNAGPGQIRIKIEYAGLRWSDISQRKGFPSRDRRPPFIPGQEVAGIIDQIGDRTNGYECGQRVMAMAPEGGYAQFLTLDVGGAWPIWPVPDSVPLDRALIYSGNMRIAHLVVYAWGKIAEGETVLLHAAAGGIGLLILQILKRRFGKVRVIGICSSDEKGLLLKENGCDNIINRRKCDYVDAVREICGSTRPGYARNEGLNGGVDVSINGVAGPTLVTDPLIIRRRGRWIIYGHSAADRPGTIDIGTLIYKGVTVMPFSSQAWWDSSEMQEANSFMLAWIASEHLMEPQIWPMDDVASAHREMEEGRTAGKVLLRVGSSMGE